MTPKTHIVLSNQIQQLIRLAYVLFKVIRNSEVSHSFFYSIFNTFLFFILNYNLEPILGILKLFLYHNETKLKSTLTINFLHCYMELWKFLQQSERPSVSSSYNIQAICLRYLCSRATQSARRNSFPNLSYLGLCTATSGA